MYTGHIDVARIIDNNSSLSFKQKEQKDAFLGAQLAIAIGMWGLHELDHESFNKMFAPYLPKDEPEVCTIL